MRLLNSTNALLMASSLVEVGAGLVLCLIPLEAVRLLTGEAFDGVAVATIARIAGAAVIGLGIACFWGRSNRDASEATGLLLAMSFYNAAAVGIFALAGTVGGLKGQMLWPAVLLHSVMLLWCLFPKSGPNPEHVSQ